MNIEIQFSRKQLLERVSQETQYRDVHPKSFYRWLQALEFTQPPYGVLHLQAVTYYADRLALGMTAKSAKNATDKYIQELTQNDYIERSAIAQATRTTATEATNPAKGGSTSPDRGREESRIS